MTAEPMTETPDAAARYERVRLGTAAWITAADAKANTLLTLCGTLLALAALAFAVASPRPSATARVGLVLFAVFDVVSAIAALTALWPRTDRAGILRDAGQEKPIEHSLTFFADLARLDFEKFTRWLGAAGDTAVAADMREQAFVLCRIAHVKMRASRVGVVFMTGALLALAFAVVWAAAEG